MTRSENTYQTIVVWLYSLLIIVHLLNIFIDHNLLIYLSGVLAVFSIILSFAKTDKLFRWTGGIFLLIGVIVFIYERESLLQIPYKMTSMLDLLGLLLFLPFITSIIKVGKYEQNVNKLLKTNVNHLGQVHNRTSISTYLLGSFLNIATLPLLIDVLKKNLSTIEDSIKNRLISTTILRAYALCLIWSPMELLVAMTVDITGISYTMYLPWLLFLSIFLLLCDWLMSSKYKNIHYERNDNGHLTISASTYKSIVVMIVSLAIFISSVNIFRNTFDLGFITAVTLVILPFSSIWAMMIRRFRMYVNYSMKIWKRKTGSLQNFFFLFLSVGFFITMLKETTIFTYLQAPFFFTSKYPILLFVLIQVIFLVFALIGFHPLVTFSILVEILKPIMGILSPMSIGLVLIMSSMSTAVAGPFNISVSLTGSMLHTNPYKISYWNMMFALLFSSAGTILALFFLKFHS